MRPCATHTGRRLVCDRRGDSRRSGRRRTRERSGDRRSTSQGPRGRPARPTGTNPYNQSFAPYLADARIMGVTEGLFGKHVRISMTTGILLEPSYERANLHADFPFGQGYDWRIPAPYPDAPILLTSLWMLTPFTLENGATVIVPGTHRANNNPSGDVGYNAQSSEIQATGAAGSVLLFDSRLWHTNGSNRSNATRVAIAVRYAAWWFNLNSLIPGLSDYETQAEETGTRSDDVVPISQATYDALPENVKPLFRHIVIGQQVLPA